MKRITWLIVPVFFLAVMFTSCDKDKDKIEDTTPTVTKAFIKGEAFIPTKSDAKKSEGKFIISFESGTQKIEIVTNDTIVGTYSIISQTLKSATDLQANISYNDGIATYLGTSGTVVIIMGNEGAISGTYNASLADDGVTIEISSGSFIDIQPVFVIPDDTKEEFSVLGVEENKATVEDAGIKLVDEMSGMENIETVGVVVNLGDILSVSDLKKSFVSKESKLISTLETFVAVANREKKVNDIYHEMISSDELSDDPDSIQQAWDENVGTYTWNPGLEDFDFVDGGDKIIVLFPSSDVSTTNDATLTISNYHGIITSNPIDEEYTGDLPVSLNAELKSGSKTLITYVFSASYNADGVPNAVASDLTIEAYKFEVDISNTSTVASANYKFTKSGTIIMEMGASGEGLFTDENIDENTTTTTYTETYGYYDYVYNSETGYYEEVWVEFTDEWEETEVEFEEIINSANAHFQLFDVAIRGDIDVKGLMDQIRLIDADVENEVISDDTANARGVSKINEYLNLRLVNVTTNDIMAKVEAYVVNEVDPEWEYENSYIDLRLTFGDGSHIDMETYFEEGFDDFVDEINGLIGDINSDYDLEIEEVDYDDLGD